MAGDGGVVGSALVVDNDPFMCGVHSITLRMLDFEVETPGSAKQAVDLLRAGASFDFVFIGTEMHLTDGLEAIKEMREMGVKSKIVSVTSWVSEAQKEALMEAGADVCFKKPLTPALIVPLIQHLKRN